MIFVLCKVVLHERQLEKQRIIHWVTPLMAALAVTGPGWSQEPGAPFKSSTAVAGPKHRDHLRLLSQMHQEQGSDSKWDLWDSNQRP